MQNDNINILHFVAPLTNCVVTLHRVGPAEMDTRLPLETFIIADDEKRQTISSPSDLVKQGDLDLDWKKFRMKHFGLFIEIFNSRKGMYEETYVLFL